MDSIGKLLKLYANAHAAYIGGAFGVGVHSITEPAGYGIPLACGPKIDKSQDAVKLEKEGGLTVIKNLNELHNWIVKIITDDNYYQKTSEINLNYVQSRTGETKVIANEINSILK